MKLLRYGPAGYEKPGCSTRTATFATCRSVIAQIDSLHLAPRELRSWRRSSPSRCRSCPGRRASACRTSASASSSPSASTTPTTRRSRACRCPQEPIIFMKATTCITGPNDDIVIPKIRPKTRLGSRARRRHRHQGAVRDEEQALDYVAGYCVVNDVSERQFQLERGSQWDKGKGCDTFGPIGPYLVTTRRSHRSSEARHVARRERREAAARQHATMIFGCAHLVSYVSQFMTLMPGDIITTGTPPGVGMGMKPPRYLQSGDIVTLGIAGLGEQRQNVRAHG